VLRIALVGCGRIARRHADLLAGGHIDGACLAAVCDIREDRGRMFGQEFGVPFYREMHVMMANGGIDAVTVLTESGHHATHVIELAQYGKPIIVEKPMALTLADADRMISACESAGVRLFVVKQNRFNVPVVKTRDALERGRFGKLILGTVRVRWCRPQSYYDQDLWRGTWALDGGVLTNQASHHLDLLEWMMGEVESVHAFGATALADVETEDTAVVALKFTSGALGTIEATTATRPRDLEGSLSLLGDGGTVEIAGFAVNELRTWKFVTPEPDDDDVMEKFSVNPPNVYGFGHQAYYEHVVACLRDGSTALVDGTVGRRSLELLSAIYESIQYGERVHLRAPRRPIKLGEQHA
jgi:UDP-N-acetyl-2-amino-2-deoxyglucuronate dehydrogenase